MGEKVSTIEVRARIDDLLNRVALRQDEFTIERKGKALAALVPVEPVEGPAADGSLPGNHARIPAPCAH